MKSRTSVEKLGVRNRTFVGFFSRLEGRERREREILGTESEKDGISEWKRMTDF